MLFFFKRINLQVARGIASSLILSCCMWLLTACNLGPVYHPPADHLPQHYSTVHKHDFSVLPNPEWWNMLGDPLLVKLINQAIHGRNLDVVKAGATVSQARAALGVTAADLYPQLAANGKIARDHLSANSEIIGSFPPGNIPLYYTNYRLSFDASWELDLFGYTRHMVEASRAHWQSAIENQHAVVITTAAEVARYYILYRVYQQRIAIARHSIASYLKTVTLVNLRLKAGGGTLADLQHVKSDLFLAQASLPSLQAEARATLNALAVMIGEYPEYLTRELISVAPIPMINSTQLAVGLPSDLLLTRPDIRKAERELAAATANLSAAVANQFPRFQLVGNLGSDTISPGTFFQSASYFWAIAPRVSIPLFQGGRLKSAVKESEAMRDGALANYKQAILQALADVESAMIRYQKEQVTQKNLLQSYEKERAAMRLVRVQYQSGQISLFNLLDVERQLDQIRDQHAQAVGQVAINLISLYKALGGAWISH